MSHDSGRVSVTWGLHKDAASVSWSRTRIPQA